ncbi:2573_t:CDS:2, partial [Racocetra fulgida]
MRYTACTSKPDSFKQENFTLRQVECEPMRQTELFILITINDEDEVLLSSTLHRVIENIAYLCSLTESPTWINKRTLSYLKALGVYQDGIAKSKVNNKTVRAHIYEYTTQISIQCSKDSVDKKTIASTQIIFCLKEKSKGKTGSHQWFFNAFCPILNPRICLLIDVGVRPVAGTCGKLDVDITNDIEDASNYNNILANNDYLAKNNVFCFELISKHNSSWILYYENSSIAEVDIPENLPEMIQQYI